MQPGEAERESPGMLPAAVTAEAPTACGGGGRSAPPTVRPRRETTGSGYAFALPKSKKASAVKKPAAREEAATSVATAVVEATRTAETTQVDSGATVLLAAAAVLVSPPPNSQTQPLVQDAGPTDTPSASPASGTQRDSSGHFRPADTFLIHCAPRPLNYFFWPSASAEKHKNHSGVTFSLC